MHGQTRPQDGRWYPGAGAAQCFACPRKCSCVGRSAAPPGGQEMKCRRLLAEPGAPGEACAPGGRRWAACAQCRAPCAPPTTSQRHTVHGGAAAPPSSRSPKYPGLCCVFPVRALTRVWALMTRRQCRCLPPGWAAGGSKSLPAGDALISRSLTGPPAGSEICAQAKPRVRGPPSDTWFTNRPAQNATQV